MPRYKVTWIIDVEADSFLGAAQKARECHLKKDNEFAYFNSVINEAGIEAGVELDGCFGPRWKENS